MPASNITQLAEDYIKELDLQLKDIPLEGHDKLTIRKFAMYLKEKGFEAEVARFDIPKVKVKPAQIAMFSQFAPNYSGGRYLTFEVACALMEAGFDVTLYCDHQPPFLTDFVDYKFPKMVIADLESVDVEADLYIGSPVLGSNRACELAIEYKKPVYSLIFDSLPLMKKFKDAMFADTKDKYWARTVELWKDSKCTLIACSAMTAKSAKKWLGKKEKDIITLYPAVNSRVLRKVPDQERTNKVVFVSRLVAHKNIDHVFAAVKETNWQLHVVTDTLPSLFHELVNKYNMQGRAFLHNTASDEDKFKLFKSAKIMINGSTFEGAGMWLQEAQACGLTTVCYEWETLRELDVLKNVYFAEYNNPKDLAKKLNQAIREWDEKQTTIPTDAFDFDKYMVANINEVFKFKPRIGVMMICLNEEKFIKAALKALIKNPYIHKVAIVEGADKRFAHAATKDGLSIDKTAEAIQDVIENYDFDKKIIYEQHGWAQDKSELRNRCIELLGTKPNWLLMVDGDEVYKPEDLNKMVSLMEVNPNLNMILFKHMHFWKKLNLMATGSQWDTKLPRCFRFDDKSLRFKEHNLPPVNKDGVYIDKMGVVISTNDIHVYHYGAMKDEKDIKAKLKYYKDRDPQLNVKDTWTNWKPGEATQWTHGGGIVMPFEGTHPVEIREMFGVKE